MSSRRNTDIHRKGSSPFLSLPGQQIGQQIGQFSVLSVILNEFPVKEIGQNDL